MNWVFVTTVLARKFHKNFSEFPLKRCGTFFLFFAIKKSLSGTETVARRISSCSLEVMSPFWTYRIAEYEFSLPFGSYVETCTSFYVFFGTQKAEGVGRLFDPYPTAPSFVPFPLSDAPAPAPLASTHCRLAVCVAVWRNSPSVTSIGLISGGHKIVTFVTKAFGRDRRLNNRTRPRRIDGKSNM
jgi:hypothetical protein